MTAAQGNLLEVLKHCRKSQRFGFEQRLLAVLRILRRAERETRTLEVDVLIAYHSHKAEIAFLLEVGLHNRHASACGLAYSLDEQALADTKFNPDVIWA